MSLMNCESCGEVVDTDEYEMCKLDDLNVCEPCWEHEQEEVGYNDKSGNNE